MCALMIKTKHEDEAFYVLRPCLIMIKIKHGKLVHVGRVLNMNIRISLAKAQADQFI